MTARERNEARARYRRGETPWKIALTMGVADAVIRYVVDHRGEREKVKARVRARRPPPVDKPRNSIDFEARRAQQREYHRDYMRRWRELRAE